MMKMMCFLCFIVFCLTFKKEGFKARKSSQHLLMAKSRRMQKYLYIVLFLDTLLCLQIIAVFGFCYHIKRLYHCHIELFAKKRNIQKCLFAKFAVFRHFSFPTKPNITNKLKPKSHTPKLHTNLPKP